jgi:hypothetical protein
MVSSAISGAIEKSPPNFTDNFYMHTKQNKYKVYVRETVFVYQVYYLCYHNSHSVSHPSLCSGYRFALSTGNVYNGLWDLYLKNLPLKTPLDVGRLGWGSSVA